MTDANIEDSNKQLWLYRYINEYLVKKKWKPFSVSFIRDCRRKGEIADLFLKMPLFRK